MTSDSRRRALRPVEPEPGVLVHSTADRRLAAGHWLLAAHPYPEQARTEWALHGVAMLPLGTLYSAVRIPGPLVQALAAGDEPRDLDAFLEDALADGPVICDPRHQRYYALVPATMPTSWRQVADDWRTHDVDCLGRGTYLGVPSPDRTDFRGCAGGSYWSVPMPSAAMLCAPLAVARLIAAGVHRLAQLAADTTQAPEATRVSPADHS